MKNFTLIKRVIVLSLFSFLLVQCQKEESEINVRGSKVDTPIEVSNNIPDHIKELVRLKTKTPITEKEIFIIKKRYESLSQSELEMFHNYKIEEMAKKSNDGLNKRDIALNEEDDFPTPDELKIITKKTLDQSILQFGVPFNKLSFNQQNELIHEYFARLLEENERSKQKKTLNMVNVVM